MQLLLHRLREDCVCHPNPRLDECRAWSSEVGLEKDDGGASLQFPGGFFFLGERGCLRKDFKFTCSACVQQKISLLRQGQSLKMFPITADSTLKRTATVAGIALLVAPPSYCIAHPT